MTFLKPKSIRHDYLTTLPDDKRAALEKLRLTIMAVAPQAEECISYRLPAFRLHGKMLVVYGATANHCAFYPTEFLHGGSLQGRPQELQDEQRHDPLSSGQAPASRLGTEAAEGSDCRE